MEVQLTLGRATKTNVLINIRWEDNVKIDLREIGCGGMD
jgi:hypothetical protein